MTSNFQDYTLPVIQDHQDYPRLVPAGETVEIPVVGEFVYCKFSDGEVKVEINGKTTYMESGDERRPNSVFRGVNLTNETANDKSVIMVIGFGRFDRKIIQGDVSIEPILRNADGTTKADTRYPLKINLEPVSLITNNWLEGDILDSGTLAGARGNNTFCDGPNGLLVNTYTLANNEYTFQFVDPWTFDVISTEKHKFSSNGWNAYLQYVPGVGFVYLDSLYHKLYAITGYDTNVLIFDYASIEGGSAGDQVDSFAYDPFEDTYVLHIGGSTSGSPYKGNYVFDRQTLTLKRKVSASYADQNLAVDKQTGNYVELGGFGSVRISDPLTGATLESHNLPSPDFYGCVFSGPYAWYLYSAAPDVIARRVSVRDYATKPTFRTVKPGCELYLAMTKAERIGQVTANITATDRGVGIEVSGELIKASLEYYFGRAMPDDYLDHVYQFDMSKDANGLEFKPISTGNKSFLAAGETDNFTTILPGQFSVVVDSELKLGGAI